MNLNNKVNLYLAIALFVIGFLVLITVCFSLYNRLLYPVLQLFKKKNEHGYVLTSENKFEHRSYVEKLMDRKLDSTEEIHHINGKKWDNRKRNLALMDWHEHQRWHQKLDWMYSKKKFPSIALQRKMLEEEFGAILF